MLSILQDIGGYRVSRIALRFTDGLADGAVILAERGISAGQDFEAVVATVSHEALLSPEPVTEWANGRYFKAQPPSDHFTRLKRQELALHQANYAFDMLISGYTGPKPQPVKVIE